MRFGHGKLTEACFLLLNIRDASAARSWLATAPLTTAVNLGRAPKTALQVAFTREGLQTLGRQTHPRRIFRRVRLRHGRRRQPFTPSGRCRSQRSAILAVGWAGKVPHVLVMLYAQHGLLEGWKQTIQGDAVGRRFRVWIVCQPPTCLALNLSVLSTASASRRSIGNDSARRTGIELDYGNLLTLGEFLLGYPNEYGKYTDRPLLAANQPSSSVLPLAEDVPDKRDLARNGTYLVLRQLRQDVRGFWRFLNKQTHSNPQNRQDLAEQWWAAG